MRLLLIAALAALFFVVGVPGAKKGSPIAQLTGVSTAAAQAEPRRRSLLNILFGRKKVKKKEVRKRSTKRRTKRRTKKRTRTTRSAKRKRTTRSRTATRAAAAAPAVADTVEKVEDAKTVLVIGDFYAGGLADGLQSAYAGVGEIKVVDKSNGLSGFVRDDVVNWPEKLPELATELKPDHIVVMLGSNDRQLMREDGKRLKKRTAEWDVAYSKRVLSLANALKETRIPYTWLGLPPVRFKNMSKDFLVFNGVYETAAKANGGEFVDIWDGFSDAEGNYSRSGPDVNGQIVLLRRKDGINLTTAGKRRLAFYIQNDLQKKLTDSTSLISPGLAFEPGVRQPRTPSYDPAKSGRTIVISLDDPAVDGAETLAGETIELDGNRATDAFAVPVVSPARRPVQREGRADDYRWPPQAPNAPPISATAEATVPTR